MTKRLTDEELIELRNADKQFRTQDHRLFGMQPPWVVAEWERSRGLLGDTAIDALPALLDEIEERRLADTKKSTGENKAPPP